MKKKRGLALMLAAAMVCSQAAPVYAAELSAAGEAQGYAAEFSAAEEVQGYAADEAPEEKQAEEPDAAAEGIMEAVPQESGGDAAGSSVPEADGTAETAEEETGISTEPDGTLDELICDEAAADEIIPDEIIIEEIVEEEIVAEEVAELDAAETTVASMEELTAAIDSADGTKTEPTVITIEGTIAVTSAIKVAGKHVKLTGGTLTSADLKATMIAISSAGSLTLENITLDGTGHPEAYYLVAASSGTVNIEDGAILQNNSNTAVYVGANGTAVMNGGKICNNTTTGWGGGIYGDDKAKVYVNGGEICNNHANYDTTGYTSAVNGGGGGIYLVSGTLHITGGTISGNHAVSNGGGVAIGKNVTNTTYDVSITGGTIKDNTAVLGANIVSKASLTIGPDAEVTEGVYLFSHGNLQNWETTGPFIILTGELKNSLEIEGVSYNGIGMRLVKMADGSSVSDENYNKLTLGNESYRLIKSEDGTLRLGNPESGYPLSFVATYSNWAGGGTR